MHEALENGLMKLIDVIAGQSGSSPITASGIPLSANDDEFLRALSLFRTEALECITVPLDLDQRSNVQEVFVVPERKHFSIGFLVMETPENRFSKLNPPMIKLSVITDGVRSMHNIPMESVESSAGVSFSFMVSPLLCMQADPLSPIFLEEANRLPEFVHMTLFGYTATAKA